MKKINFIQKPESQKDYTSLKKIKINKIKNNK
jgi:hypothetical protein